MKILMVDKYYFIKGGAERYCFELSLLLEKNGHEVIPFSMKHADNFTTSYEKFFVENIEYNLNSNLAKIKNSLKITSRMIYSIHAKNMLERLIRSVKPDIAHLHMIDHQISPSILHVLKKHNIPVIQTVHQYKLACPNYRLYNMKRKKICEKCLFGHYYHPIFEKCHKDSAFAGMLIGLETYIHKKMKIYEKNIDVFHVPSKFMGSKLEQAGIEKNKIHHFFYTINIDNYKPHFDFENYILYYGRLAKEKGILTLLKAMVGITNTKLLVVGDGQQRAELEAFCLKKNLDNVEFLGIRNGENLKSIISKAKFIVVPSEWYDNSPLVIYESFSLGKPVIGSNLGGIPELIDDEKNGFIFEQGNVDQLSEKMTSLIDNADLIKSFGKNARYKAETEFAPEPHYGIIIKEYNNLKEKVTN